MNAPLISSFTLISELVISTGILIVFYQAFFKNKFNTRLAFGLLAYEYLVNIVYMVYRVVTHVESSRPTSFEIMLLAFHGILSLVMILVLTSLFILAYFAQKKGSNLIRKHSRISLAILAVWFVSVLSGISVYVMEYIFKI